MLKKVGAFDCPRLKVSHVGLLIFYFLQNIFRLNAQSINCMPSQGVDQCYICSADYYYKEPGVVDGKNILSEADCKRKLNGREKINNVYVSANSLCPLDILCDGTPEHPFDNLLKGLLAIWKENDKYQMTETSFLLLGENHNIPGYFDSGYEKIDLFRRTFASLTIKTLYCDELPLDGCFQRGNMAKIRFSSPYVQFYVTKKLFLSDLIFTGSGVLFEESEFLKGANPRIFSSGAGLLNIERIIDENYTTWGWPTIEIENCVFKNIYAVGTKKAYGQTTLVGFSSLLNIENNWGSAVILTNSSVVGGYYADGLVKHTSTSNSFYKNIEQNWLIGITFMLAKGVKIEFYFNNCTFRQYNQYNVYDPTKLRSDQALIYSRITDIHNISSLEFETFVKIEGCLIEEFSNEDSFIGSFLRFEGNLRSSSSFIFDKNRIINNDFDVFAQFYKNLKQIEFRGNLFMNNKGDGLIVGSSNISIQELCVENHLISSFFVAIKTSRLDIVSSSFKQVYLKNMTSQSAIRSFIIIAPNLFTILIDEFDTPKSKNSSRNIIYIENVLFNISNISLISDSPITTYVISFELKSSIFTNISLEKEFLRMSIENILGIYNTQFSQLACKNIISMPFGRNVEIIGSAFNNILGSVLRINHLGMDSNNSMYCHIVGSSFLNIYSVSNPYIFIIDVSFITSYYDFSMNSSEIKNIAIHKDTEYDWSFDPAEEKYWCFLLKNSQIVQIFNLTIYELYDCSAFLFIHYNYFHLPYYHSSAYIDGISFSNNNASSFGFLKMLDQRQILMKNLNIKAVNPSINSYFIDINTFEGALSIVNSLFEGVGSTTQGAIFNLRVHNITALYVSGLQIKNCPNLLSSAFFILNEIYSVGHENLKYYSNNNLSHSKIIYNDTELALGFIQMPREFGIFNSKFTNASTYYYGLLILLSKSELVLINCSISNIEANVYSGALFLHDNSAIYVENSSFQTWRSLNAGGCIVLTKFSNLISLNLTFRSTETPYGSAIIIEKAYAEVYSSYFYDLKGANGGAISTFISNIKLVNSLFEYNDAWGKGGGVYSESSSVYLESCAFYYHRAEEHGAVLYLKDSSSGLLINITLSQSAASQKGTLYIYGKKGSEIIIVALTCEGNRARVAGCIYQEEGMIRIYGAVIYEHSDLANLIIVNSIFSKAEMLLTDCIIRNNYFSEEIILLNSCKVDIFNVTFFGNANTKCLINALNANINMFFGFLSQENIIIKEANTLFYFIKTEGSNIFFYRVDANGCNSTGFTRALQSKITFGHGNLQYFKSPKGGCFYQKTSSGLNIISSELIQSSSDLGSVVFSEDSNIFLYSVLIKNSVNSQGGAVFALRKVAGNINVQVLLSEATIECSEANKFVLENLNGFTLLNASVKFSLIGTEFSKSIASENIAAVRFIFCNFSHLSSIYLNSRTNGSILIHCSSFSDFQSSSNGGALYVTGVFIMYILESKFYNNSAKKKGGAIFLDCLAVQCIISINFCDFITNSAEVNGGAFSMIHPATYVIANTIFLNNIAPVGNNTAGYPKRLLILKGIITEFSLKEIVFDMDSYDQANNLTVSSGQSTKITILVIDSFANHLESLNEGVISITTNASMIEGNQAIVNNGEALFKNLLLIGKPDNYVWARFKYSSRAFFFEQKHEIYIRNCNRGEIFFNNLCIPCEYGFFSIMDPSTTGNSNTYCEVCPSNADCLGSDKILAKEGYFRLHGNTSLLATCKIISACPDQVPIYEALQKIGSRDNFPFHQQICRLGYVGNLCSFCDQHYSKIADGMCVKCSSDIWYYFKYLFYLLGSCGFLILQGILAMDFGENESQKRSLFKIIINHSYFISYINRFQVTWSREFIDFLEISDKYMTSIPKEIVSFDCFLAPYMSEIEIHLSTYTIYLLHPLVLVVFCFVLRLLTIEIFFYIKCLLDFRKRKLSFKEFKTKISTKELAKKWVLIVQTLWVVSMYNLYSRTVLSTLELLKCIYLDDSHVTYMEKFPNYACWYSEEHKKLLLFGFAPNFFLWCIAWPSFLFFVLKYNNDRLIKNSAPKINLKRKLACEPNLLKTSVINILKMQKVDEEIKSKHKIYKFLTMDYINKCYFWEIVFYVSNLFLSSLIVATSNLNSISQGGILIMFFVFLLMITEKKKPFRSPTMNKMQVIKLLPLLKSTLYFFFHKVASYIIMIFTTAFSMLTTERFIISSTQKFAYIALIFLVNFIFYLIWFLTYLKTFLISIKNSKFMKILLKYKLMRKAILTNRRPRTNSKISKGRCDLAKIKNIPERQKLSLSRRNSRKLMTKTNRHLKFKNKAQIV